RAQREGASVVEPDDFRLPRQIGLHSFRENQGTDARSGTRDSRMAPSAWAPSEAAITDDRKSMYPAAYAHANADVRMPLPHFVGRPAMHRLATHQRERVTGVAHLAIACSIQRAAQRDQCARRVIHGFHEAGHDRDEAAGGGFLQARALRRVERVGKDFDLAVVGKVLYRDDTAAPDDLQ